jgi:hypothetical protein
MQRSSRCTTITQLAIQATRISLPVICLFGTILMAGKM